MDIVGLQSFMKRTAPTRPKAICMCPKHALGPGSRAGCVHNGKGVKWFNIDRLKLGTISEQSLKGDNLCRQINSCRTSIVGLG